MLNLNQIIRAIRKLVMDPIVKLQDTTKRFSEPVTIDLSEARNQKEYNIYGDVMIVEDIDGTAIVYLNNKEGSPHLLRIGRKIYQDFFRFFITNSAQAGKTLKIVVGREGCFDITETDYWLNLLKDKQDEAITVLENIKAKTEGIIDQSILGTIAKQDEIKNQFGKEYELTLSDVVQIEDNAEETTQSTTWNKYKQFTMLSSGMIKVKGQINTDAGRTCSIQIRVNDINISGAGWSTGSTSYVDKESDIGVGTGDLVQLWMRTSEEGHNARLRNVKICCDQILGAPSVGVVS